MTALAGCSEQTMTRGWPFPPLWVVRVRHTGDEELFIAGEFNRWQLPGVPMARGADGVWQARIPLTTTDVCRFACFVLDACGFRAVPGATVVPSLID